MKLAMSVALAAGLAVSAAVPASAAETEPKFETREYTTVWLMPDSATHRLESWFPQRLVSTDGTIPQDACGKFQIDKHQFKVQIDRHRVTNSAQADAFAELTNGEVLTLERNARLMQASGFLGGGQDWSNKCPEKPQGPTTPPVVEPPVVTPPVVVPPVTEPPTTPEPPVVVPPVKPEPPVVAPPAAKVTKRLVQVDTYNVTSSKEAAAVRAFAKDGKLVYREDKAQWNDSVWRIEEQTLVNNVVTETKVLKTGGTGAKAKGTKLTYAWALGSGATVNQPWGPKFNIAQRLI